MRAVVQRVARAAVTVEGRTVGAIDAGLLVLVGITHGDGPAEVERMARKLVALRLFPDGRGRIDEPLGPDRRILCISQFTLYGETRKGNRPSYRSAAPPAVAEPLYDQLCERLGAARGIFGAQMEVELVNDGPVTVIVEIDGAAGRDGRRPPPPAGPTASGSR